MKKLTATWTIMGLLCVLGCVNVVIPSELTITIDIRHIEEQADGLLDFVEGKSDVLPGFEESSDTSSLIQGIWNALSPMEVVHAQMKTTSGMVQEIASSMKKRNAAVSNLKAQGCFGENNRGYLELRECDGLADADKKNEAQQLLAEENKDRKALYREIARLNKAENLTVSLVEGIYANQRLKRAKSGEACQLPAAGPDFNAFKASAAGKKLGGQCVAGAWVTIP
jgi:uncharacterized protein YdbL (DUF1318 family)